jgi:hypothetical protein
VAAVGGGPVQGGSTGGLGAVSPNGLIRNRYIDVTEQVRRMPVGLVVVVDQANVQDFLTAFANSRLRIQTTQVHWQHMRDSIKPPVEGSSGGGPGVPGGPAASGGIRPGGGGAGPDDDARMGSGGGAGLGGGKFRPGSSAAMPGSPGPGMAPGRPLMPGMPPMMPGTMPSVPGGGIPGGMPGLGSGAEDHEDDMNLVELAIYGVASLYERYPPKKDQAAPEATTPPATPAAGN